MVNPFSRNLSPGLVGGVSGQPVYPYKIGTFNNTLGGGTGGVRLDGGDYMSQSFSTNQNGSKYVISVWLKRTRGFEVDGHYILFVNDSFTDTLFHLQGNSSIRFSEGLAGALYEGYIRFPDNSNWGHIILSVDTDEAAAADRVKMWWNGNALTDWTTETTIGTQSADTSMFKAVQHRIGTDGGNFYYWHGYMSEFHALNGYSIQNGDVSVSSFGKLNNGVWVPVKYDGPWGTNGWYLNFSNATTIGEDSSGNNNDWTPIGGLGSAHCVPDNPTNNFPVLSDLNRSTRANVVVRGDGLEASVGTDDDSVMATHPLPRSGKWYFELDFHNVANGWFGIANEFFNLEGGNQNNAFCVACLQGSTTVWRLGNPNLSYFSAAPGDEVIGCAVDMDNEELYFIDDTGSKASLSFSSGGHPFDFWLPFVGGTDTGAGGIINFGQAAFTHTKPAGYKTLCSEDLDSPAIIGNDNNIRKISEGFGILLYEGTGAENVQTGLNFKPDFYWGKDRESGTTSHQLVDSMRGATKHLESDSNDGEADVSQGVKSFDEGGVTLGTSSLVNANTNDFVAFCLKRGQEYGFDIVTYTGTGVAHAENHNLGGVPELIIIKQRSASGNSWAVYHWAAPTYATSNAWFGALDIPNAWQQPVAMWNDTGPTSTQFTVGTSAWVNGNTSTYVAYLFRSIPGFSRVFHYEGKGTSPGRYIPCDFRPGFIMVKNADASANWVIMNGGVQPYGHFSRYIAADLPGIESNANYIDVCSTGFHIRNTFTFDNSANTTYVGIAIADQVMKFANSR